eukprot:scaffold463_cov107-Skeletonema_dohrnii-CCMP3373.AAC.3
MQSLKAEGDKLAKDQKWSAAAKKYKKAISIDDGSSARVSAAVWSNLALCYDKMKDIENYLVAAKKCVAADSSFAKGYIRLARAYHLKYLFEKQKEVIEVALRILPENADLQAQLKMVEETIKMRAEFQELVIQVPLESPLLLGMTPELAEITVRNNSQRTKYLALERGRLPPISSKYEDLSQFDEEIRPVLGAFFNEELIVKWSCGANLVNGITLSIEGYIPNDPVPIRSILIYEQDALNIANANMVMSIAGENLKIERFLSRDHGGSIEAVMLLRFFREVGAMVANLLTEDYFLFVAHVAAQRLQQLKLYKDSLDLWLTCSDICLGKEHKNLDKFILKVADELQANKRYKDGANLYLELASDGVYTGENVQKAVLHGKAGQAFARAMDYVNSESEYIAFFREYGPNWEWTDPPKNDPSNLLTHMMGMYSEANQALASGLYTDEAHKQLDEAFVVLIGLLTCAGCMSPNYPQFEQSNMLMGALQPQYKQKQAAFNAVFRDAFMAPNVTEYHNRLKSCLVPGLVSKPIIWRDGSDTKAKFVKKQKAVNKQRARRWIRDKSGMGKFFEVCAGCSIAENEQSLKMKQCPCKMVYYCSEVCQRNHWPIHKTSCSTKKKEKKSN